MGGSATIRPLDESVPFTLVDTLSVFNTVEGQFIFGHFSPWEYQRPGADVGSSEESNAVIIFLCFEGEIIQTFNANTVCRSYPGKVTMQSLGSEIRSTTAVPVKFLTAVFSQPTALSASGLSAINPVLETEVDEGLWDIIVRLATQLEVSLKQGEEEQFSVLLKALEVVVDQALRPNFLRQRTNAAKCMLNYQDFIDQQIRNPLLGVGLLCEHFNVSRATLYRQMAHLGGVKHYLLTRRLINCFDAICKSPGAEEAFLKVLAKSYHFKSWTDFIVRYEKHFGIDPTTLLARAPTKTAANTATGLVNIPFA